MLLVNNYESTSTMKYDVSNGFTITNFSPLHFLKSGRECLRMQGHVKSQV